MTARIPSTSIAALLIAVCAASTAVAAPAKSRARARGNPPPPAPAAVAPEAPAFTYHLSVTGSSAHLAAPVGYPMIRQDVVTLYQHRLGHYPRIESSGPINGGIPQNTDLQAHLAKAKRDIEQQIPNPEWDGLAVIDFECWTPIWSRTGETYRAASREHARRNNPSLSGDALERVAKREFLEAGKAVFLETLLLGKRLRPNAKWGFYGYPDEHRPQDMDEIPWMWENVTAVFPSLYHMKRTVESGPAGEGEITLAQAEDRVRIMLQASRHLAPNAPVYGFIWERYHESNRRYAEQLLTPLDLELDMTLPQRHGANGVILWTHLQDARYISDSANYLRQKTFPAVKRAHEANVAAAAAAAAVAPGPVGVNPDIAGAPAPAKAPINSRKKPKKKPTSTWNPR